jgi:hypothetical protein
MKRKVALMPIGMILIFFGSVWFLQGIGILPGSIMTGSTFWAVAGGLSVLIGLALAFVGAKGVTSN